jgi:hypothetical protein
MEGSELREVRFLMRGPGNGVSVPGRCSGKGERSKAKGRTHANDDSPEPEAGNPNRRKGEIKTRLG